MHRVEGNYDRGNKREAGTDAGGKTEKIAWGKFI